MVRCDGFQLVSLCCREIYELGMRAFVSFVHFYYKHESKLIFRARGELPVFSSAVYAETPCGGLNEVIFIVSLALHEICKIVP